MKGQGKERATAGIFGGKLISGLFLSFSGCSPRQREEFLITHTPLRSVVSAPVSAAAPQVARAHLHRVPGLDGFSRISRNRPLFLQLEKLRYCAVGNSQTPALGLLVQGCGHGPSKIHSYLCHNLSVSGREEKSWKKDH